MGKWVVRVLGASLLAGFVYLNVDYWRDPVYWRRWWDTMTHMQPDYLNLKPLEEVPGAARTAAAGSDRGGANGHRMKRCAPPRAMRRSLIPLRSSSCTGVASRRNGIVPGWPPERLTQSQSMTKTVTALMLGAAIADGYVKSPDDTVDGLPDGVGR